MGSPRRTIIAGTGTIVAGIAGAWTVLSDEGDDGTSNTQSQAEGGTTSKPANATREANASRDDAPAHSDLPEAATPEANPEIETNDSVIAEAGEVGQTEPTSDNVAISSPKITTSQRGAILTVTVRNTVDIPVTVDLEVAFPANGTRLTTSWGGVTGLCPSKSAEVVLRVRGQRYAKATDYRVLTKEVSPTMAAR